ncbi:hypothetical protein GGR13_000886 [Brevundimonas variabilis]|uniref:Uncharacterized protein n=1 Tax=Brevundimonas variabilis TaxID=74312 RepID=A0A7W9CGP0_9CAUL|nr:hypothetical protein [Brevundimonas variabilis]
MVSRNRTKQVIIIEYRYSALSPASSNWELSSIVVGITNTDVSPLNDNGQRGPTCITSVSQSSLAMCTEEMSRRDIVVNKNYLGTIPKYQIRIVVCERVVKYDDILFRWHQ